MAEDAFGKVWNNPKMMNTTSRGTSLNNSIKKGLKATLTPGDNFCNLGFRDGIYRKSIHKPTESIDRKASAQP